MLVPDANLKISRMLVTKSVQNVTNISKLSRTHSFSNIRHQHRWSQSLRLIIFFKSKTKAEPLRNLYHTDYLCSESKKSAYETFLYPFNFGAGLKFSYFSRILVSWRDSVLVPEALIIFVKILCKFSMLQFVELDKY